MICKCGVKMKCKFSAPVGTTGRHRAYQCLVCGEWEDSIEMGLRGLEGVKEIDVDALRRVVRRSNGRRVAVIKRVRGEAGEGSSSG